MRYLVYLQKKNKMKISLLLLSLFCFVVASYSQITTDSIRVVSKHENSFGFAFEYGGGFDVSTHILTEKTYRADVNTTPSIGYSLSYDHKFNFSKASSIVASGGVGYTGVKCQFDYLHDEPVFNKRQFIDLGTTKFVSLNLSLFYSHNVLPRNPNTEFSIYGGVKIRNVLFIDGEQRSKNGFSGGSYDVASGNDTLNVKYIATSRMIDSRVVLMPVLGLNIAKKIANNGKLNLFLDYTFNIPRTGNSLLVAFSQTSVTQNNGSTFAPGNPLFMTLNMSFLRIGAAYTLPTKGMK